VGIRFYVRLLTTQLALPHLTTPCHALILIALVKNWFGFEFAVQIGKRRKILGVTVAAVML